MLRNYDIYRDLSREWDGYYRKNNNNVEKETGKFHMEEEINNQKLNKWWLSK